MARPRKSEQTDLKEAIISTAWQQIADQGASALSLREIARRLGITAPAIYNHFRDRDALVTALIIEAYGSFADAQQAATDRLPADAHRRRLAALGHAYRQWAVAYPARYQLIFGSGLPGCHPEADAILPVSARALSVLVFVLADAHAAGKLRPSGYPAPTQAMQAMLNGWQGLYQMDPEILYHTFIFWSRVHGLVSLEIGCHYPPFVQSPAELFNREIEKMSQAYIP